MTRNDLLQILDSDSDSNDKIDKILNQVNGEKEKLKADSVASSQANNDKLINNLKKELEIKNKQLAQYELDSKLNEMLSSFEGLDLEPEAIKKQLSNFINLERPQDVDNSLNQLKQIIKLFVPETTAGGINPQAGAIVPQSDKARDILLRGKV